MNRQKKKTENGKWLQIVTLLTLAFMVLLCRSLTFKDRLLETTESEAYFAMCAQLGSEIPLLLFRLRELGWIACSVLVAVLVGYGFLSTGGTVVTICALVLLPNEWWVLVLTVVWVVALAWMRIMPVCKRIPSTWLLTGVCLVSGLCLIIGFAGAIREWKTNRVQTEKQLETLTKIAELESTVLYYNQLKHEDILSYYLEEYELIWHEKADIDQIESEYLYMIYEEGEWFSKRMNEEYGFTYTDLGPLWISDLGDSLRLLQVQWGKYSAQVRTKEAITQISSKVMDGVMIPMFPMANFDPFDFEVFIESKVLNLDEIMYTGVQLIGAIENILLSTDSIQTVYVGLNLERMGDANQWEELSEVIGKYPNVQFCFLAVGPMAEELSKTSAMAKWEKSITKAVEIIDEAENAEMVYVGNQAWLLLNNRTFSLEEGFSNQVAKDVLARELILRNHVLTKDNLSEQIEIQKELVDEYKKGTFSISGLGDKNILFLGDSVFGYTYGDVSIPGVVQKLSKAHTYNLGYGGMTGATYVASGTGAWESLQAILTNDVQTYGLDANMLFTQEVKRLWDDKVLADTIDGENLVFVLNYGLNDYFNDIPLGDVEDTKTDSYLGAMRKVIEEIKENYPKATILTLTQNMVSEFDFGEIKKGPEKKTLEDFRKGLETLSDNCGVACLRINEAIGLNKDNTGVYIIDGTHPSFNGNFWYGYAIAKRLEQMLWQK